ncbi:SGNH/GDSL hydrolase family protein [Chitinophaga ginsengisegetis]|uniref:SGNH/GDSL hydrolase family protein n=1 Tax=Chitinophaga ginsengisegetis TaxID=393003 RepID=UPI003446473A
MDSRRIFLKKVFLLSGLAVSCKKNQQEDFIFDDDLLEDNFDSKIILKQNATLLFIGDSITDAARDKSILVPNSEKGLGDGFVRKIAVELMKKGQFEHASIYNRGISGNTITDLLNRWNNDAIALKPDTISILIGVNDVRRKIPPNNFYDTYRQILNKTRTALPNAEIIICEPFIFPNITGYGAINPIFKEYRKVIRKIATEFNTVFVPYYDAFKNQAQTVSPASLLPDGFHPAAPLGINLLKDQWLATCAF